MPRTKDDIHTLPDDLPLPEDDGVVTHVFYPVFPPDSHAAEVLSWLRA